MKHLDKMTKFCFAGYLLTLSTFTLACNPGQGSGQCGYYDNSGYHNAPIGSYSGNNYKQPTRVIKLSGSLKLKLLRKCGDRTRYV